MKLAMLGFSILIFLLFLVVGTSANLDEVKANASPTWQQAGYEIIGYEGFQWGTWLFGNYGGAKVWHSLRRVEGNENVIYTGFIQRWGDEFHIYNIRAIDAISP